MDIKIQLIVAVTDIIAIIIIINMVRKKSLELRYALAWLVLGMGIFILACFPQVISFLAQMMGIGLPINMVFFMGFCFSLAIIFVLTMAVSRMSTRIKKLAQALALLEEKSNQKDSRTGEE